VYDDDYVRFSRLLMNEVQQSGRRRIDELHFLLAFMKTKEGLPARVFGELGITPAQVAERGQPAPGSETPALEKLYSPEEVADYLGVHVQTVRGWIRSGRLPARRLAGQRALRVRACDLSGLLEPVNPDEI
jgi:excisionase family DNA binding protein